MIVMADKFTISLFIIILVLLFTTFASDVEFWEVGSPFVQLRDSNLSFRVQSLQNCDKITTNNNGDFLCGRNAYGEIFFNNVTAELMITLNDVFPTFFNVTDGGLMMGLTKNMQVIDGNSTFFIEIPGIYEFHYSGSVSTSPNRVIMMAVLVNGTSQTNSFSHRKVGSGGDIGNQGDPLLLNLSYGSHVGLGISLVSGGNTDADFSTMNFNLNLIEKR